MPALACMRVQPQMAEADAAAAWEDGKAPGEVLAKSRSELAAFDELLAAVEVFQQEISAATAQLAAAPAALLKKMEQCCSDGPGVWGQLVPQLSAQFDKAAAGLHSGTRHMEAVQYLLEQCREQSAEAHEAFRSRDSAWAPKARCDRRAAELRKRFGPRLLLAEKKARLQEKHQADQEFQQRTDEAAKAVDDILNRRWAIVGAIAWEICRHHMAVFKDAEKTFAGFNTVANTLVPPVPTESQMVAADSVIASCNALPGVREWVEKARSAATMCEARTTLELPPRRRPVLPPPTPALQRLGAAAPPQILRSAAAPAPPPPPLRALAAAAPVIVAAGAPVAAASSLPTMSFAEGDAVQVWSASVQSWVDASVEKIFSKDEVAQGYWVTAGSIKVSFPMGAKFVRPEHIAETLRRRPAPAAPVPSGCVQN